MTMHAHRHDRAERGMSGRPQRTHLRQLRACSVARESDAHADATGKYTDSAACAKRVEGGQNQFRVAAIRHSHATYKPSNEEAEDAQDGCA